MLILLHPVECYSMCKTFMVLCTEIFKYLDFVSIQSWMTWHITSLKKKKRKRNHHHFVEQI